MTEHQRRKDKKKDFV